MEYRTAKSIRGRSLSSLITEKIVSGGGVGSSIKKAISEKMRAKATGIKEKFDPMNVVKFLTGGSNLAAAVVGRLTGRKKSDIEYFTNRGNRTATRIGRADNLGQISSDSLDSIKSLFMLIKKSHEDDLKLKETERTFREERVNEDNRRHQEFLNILKKYTNASATVVPPIKEESSGILDFLKSMFEKFLEPFKWLLKNKQLIFSILRLFTGPLAGILLAGSAIVWLAEQLKDYFRENVANQNVISPEKAVELLQTPGAFREIEKFGGREALLKIAKEGHIEAAKILATGDKKKINDAGGEEFLKAVVARGAVTVPENLEKMDLTQFAEQGPKRPKGTGLAVKSNQEKWDKTWSKIYDPETGKRLDLLSKPAAENSNDTSPGTTPSASPATQNMSQMPETPSSSPVAASPASSTVYDRSSENVNLNMSQTMGGSAQPVVTSSVTNTSTDQPLPATASTRDDTEILNRIFRQSTAVV